MVGPARRRQAIEHILSLGMCSSRRACRWFGLSRSALYRPPKSDGELEALLLRRIVELSLEYPTYGYRFITAKLRKEGWRISFKKVQRLRRKEGLAAKANTARKTRRGTSSATPAKAEAVNGVWCWDFIHDVTEDGRSIRILSIVDEYSRFCVELDGLPFIEGAGCREAPQEGCREIRGAEADTQRQRPGVRREGDRNLAEESRYIQRLHTTGKPLGECLR